MALSSLVSRVEALSSKCAAVLGSATVTNRDRRRLHAEVSLLEMDLEELSFAEEKEEEKALTTRQGQQQQLQVLSQLGEQLKLHFVKRRGFLLTILDLIDEAVRIIAVWLFLVDTAFLLAVPAVILDLVYPHQPLTILAKQFVGHSCLILSAVTLTVRGVKAKDFAGACNLLCFSHASTMDAFILSAAVPVRHYSLAKSTLFLIPFFSWHLAAYGGVAIDRTNKEQAIDALSAAAASASVGDCVAVAPEGTRSKTGQLLPFKKGPFYLWESLKGASVIPVVIYGAFELYPPGKQMSLPGKVVMQYLPPVRASEASNREEMSQLVRRRMLEAIATETPDNVGDTAVVVLSDRIGNFLAILTVFAFNALLLYAVRFLVSSDGGGVSMKTIALLFFGSTSAITACLYLFKVYVQPRWITSNVKKKGKVA